MTFLCLSRIALSHFLNTLYSNMDSISSLMASYHLLFLFSESKLHGFHVVAGDEVPKHVSLGSPDLSDLTLLDCSCKDFILLGKAPESTPSF